MMLELEGKLLLSCDMGVSEEDSFSGAVVYLHKHDASGTTGYILNRPLADPGALLTESLEIDGVIPQMREGDLHFGGPVSLSRLSVLYEHRHQVAVLNQRVAIEAFASGNIVHNSFAAILGYSAWEPGQLLEEIKNHCWQVVSLPVRTVLQQPDITVNDMLRQAYGSQVDFCLHSCGSA